MSCTVKYAPFSTGHLVAEIGRLDETLRLVQACHELTCQPRQRYRLLSLEAHIETQLSGLRHRMLAGALSDLLWSFLEYDPGSNAWLLARQLLVEIEAHRD